MEEEKKDTTNPAAMKANGCTFTAPGAGGNRMCLAAEKPKNDNPDGTDVTSLAAFHHNKLL